MAEGSDPPLPPGGVPLTEFTWRSWTPREVAERLRDVGAPWAIAAGWAIDLFRGGVTRDHEDTEIAIGAQDFSRFRAALSPFEFDLVGGGMRWPVSDERALAITHQTWLRDPGTGAYLLDVFREPHDGRTWTFRRDRSISRPYVEVVRTSREGLPYVAPEIVLLFKARLMRPKDAHDFEGALPLMDASARAWLLQALERVHPEHEWIGRLRA